MQWSDLPFNPPARTLRQFAVLLMLCLGGMSAWQYAAHAHHELAVVLGVMAVAVGPLGAAFPHVLRPVFVVWLTVAFPIGWTVSRVLLRLIFWLAITPTAVASRLAGRDVLRLRRPRHVRTYWTPKERPSGVRSYFRQY
jgi:hypothetical protein